ncbi:FAD-binding oxidoreductase [Aliikangiella maris]|uniref:FAD-binding oxidoreductase n=2 Tax=Aliikangiella maris TaxID=3162458 RepID=A0ABV2BRR5_9GAMM
MFSTTSHIGRKSQMKPTSRHLLPIRNDSFFQSLMGINLRIDALFGHRFSRSSKPVNSANPKTLNNAFQSVEGKNKLGAARLVDKYFYTEDICRIRLEPIDALDYHAGQFINLQTSESCNRSYAITNTPLEGDYLELHIRRKLNGEMSNWLLDEFEVNDYIHFSSAMGNCYYAQQHRKRPLVFISTGAGAGGLYGIVKDALHHEHQGPMYFYHGCRDNESLYLTHLLTELQNETSNFYYLPSITREKSSDTVLHGRCNQYVMANLMLFSNAVFYISGNAGMVKDTRSQLIEKGIQPKDILVMPFESKDLRKTPRDQ